MASTSGQETPIILRVIHQSAYVWNSRDACYLREQQRIPGTLVGCLPRLPRQNIHLGLPLLLLPEEATLLVEKGIAKLVDDTGPPELPSEEDLQQFRKKRKELYEQQVEVARASMKRDLVRRQAQILEGKKVKRNKLLQQRREGGEHISDSEFEKEVEFDVESVKIPPLPEKHSMVQIHTATLEPRHPEVSPVWTFPQTAEEKLKYRVYTDLWEKGFYLTSAGKFGGHYLVYPGDPGRFHSQYIALCVPNGQTLSTVELAALGRLGTNVKKTVLLCSVNDSDELAYNALEWSKDSSS